MEILSPIKNLKNARIAIKNGANALYLASPSFGARVNASIEMNEIKEIIRLAKSYNVKTYITFNTIIFENELTDFFNEVNIIYNYGANAVIVQDVSFIPILKEKYNNLEVHCSTQMHIHNTNGTKIVKELGANQVVVPREMSFERIRNIKDNVDIKIEAFIHGALCVSYSGQCYDSTLLDQKSANRGRCSQYCRMPQHVINKRNNKIVSKGMYPLNLKDLNNLTNLEKYKEAGVYSLKIEGRLKGIDYVGLTTLSYSNRLNSITDNNIIDLDNVYNRTFTSGRINHKNGKNLVNLYKPNNTGIEIGKVISCKKNSNNNLKYYSTIITIELHNKETIEKGDNLRFIHNNNESGQTVEQLETVSKGIYNVYSTEEIKESSIVFKTKNNKLIKDYENQVLDFLPQREAININIYISQDYSMFTILFNNEEIQFNLDLHLSTAKNNPINKKDVIDILDKTKNTPYKIIINDIYIENNLFIPVKILKYIRDEITNKYKELTSTIETKAYNYSKVKIESKDSYSQNTICKYYFNCKTVTQLEYFSNLESDLQKNIILMIDFEVAKSIVGNTNILTNLKNKYELFLTLPRIIYDDEEIYILEILKYFDNICISEIGSLKYRSLISGTITTNFTFNTTNSININFLEANNINNHILSIELNNSKINEVATQNSIVNIYGKIPVMIMDYCPINLNKTDTCGSCTRCHNNDYFLKDKLNREFPLQYEGNNRIGLYSPTTLSLFDHINEIPSVNKFYLNLTTESNDQIDDIIQSITENKNYIKNSFTGNFFKETL